jgi:hypothetical protein
MLICYNSLYLQGNAHLQVTSSYPTRDTTPHTFCFSLQLTSMPSQNDTSNSSENPPISPNTPTTKRSSPYKAPSIFSSVHSAISKGLHEQNFKSGAFAASMPFTTSHNSQTQTIIAAFNTLLASPLLSPAEKEAVKYCRIQFIHLRNLFPDPQVPSHAEASGLIEKLRELQDMFEKDAETREQENIYGDCNCEFSLFFGEEGD